MIGSAHDHVLGGVPGSAEHIIFRIPANNEKKSPKKRYPESGSNPVFCSLKEK